MRLFKDFEGRSFRFTDERMNHVSGHPEMKPMMQAIEETLTQPERVVQSLTDPEARLYYRFYRSTPVGEKYLCVVGKLRAGDAFILTAYLTDSIKKGTILWPKK